MIKFRLYSRYDDTDVIKSSQDSSILNKEEKGKTSDSTKVGLAAVAGGLIGASGKSTKLGKLGGGAKGAASRTLFSRMTKDERAALIKFLQSL